MNSKLSLSTITKVVNILFLIVLQNYILDCGMGIFGVSLIVYYLLYTVLFGSLQTVISKLVNVRNSKGMGEHTKHIVKPALIYVVLSGVLLVLFSFFCLERVTVACLGMVYPVPVIQIFCVVMIITAITDVLCGYHTGNGNVHVVNIANLLKCIFPIGLSIFILRMFASYGNSISLLLKNPIIKDAYMAMGTAVVYLMSTIIVFLVVLFFTIKIRLQAGRQNEAHNISRRTSAGGFLSMHIKLMLNSVFPVLCIFASVVLYIRGIEKAGLAVMDAYTNIGILFGKLLLPIILILIIFSEYIAREKHRLHVDYRKDEIKIMTVRAQYMIKNSIFMLLPPMMVLIFLSNPIAKVVFSGQVSLSSKYLQYGGAILLLAGIVYALNNILKAFDKEVFVWVFQGGAYIAQIIFLVVGFSKGTGNSMLILYSFYFYYGILFLGFFAMTCKIIRLDILDILLKLGKYGVAGIIAMILFMILSKFIEMNIFLLVLSIFFGYLLYYLTLIALHGISKKDEAALKRTLNYYPVHFLRSRLRL